jgi:molecular chaperone DnaK
MGRIIGIDLGTTYSAVAYLENGNPKVIEQRNGRKNMPSVVCINDDEILVGENALKQDFTLNTIKRIKRKIGTDYRAEINGKQYSPEEVSAYILKELKNRAEEFLGEEVRDAIITVPAYFNDNQRQATKDAGKIAGLNVIRIINEPTAASLSYGVNPEHDANIIVYDLGGGTFDVSLVNVGDGIFEVIATAGDNRLGGEDFNRRIEEIIVNKFKDETGIDLTDDPLAMAKLSDAVEDAKITLSSKKSVKIHIPFITADENGAHDINFEFTRDEFEKLISDYIERTIELCKQAVDDARLEAKDIDRVILVGGSSRIPYIRGKIKGFFGKEPDYKINPEEVVAMGAAIQGGIVQGDVSGIVLVDVTPMSLGIEVENGYFVPIIERNNPIPTCARRIFTTVADGQKSVDVHILQGESMKCDNNISLGKFRLEGIRKAMKGEPRIEVTFELDVNGILNVTATDADTQSVQGITIVNDSRIDEKELERLREEHLKSFDKDIKNRKRFNNILRLKTKAEYIAGKIEAVVPPAYRDELIKEEISEILLRAQSALEELDIEKAESAVDALEFIMKELKAGNYKGGERIA